MLKPLYLKEIITTTKNMHDTLEGIYDWEHQRMSSSGKEEIEKVWKEQLPNLEQNINGLVEELDEDYRQRKHKALRELPKTAFPGKKGR
jgi:hypothetical protein|tara:strand:+ start:306 stop:572 length:267 start_codon:yes stop_codon:yes gene_type:complete